MYVQYCQGAITRVSHACRTRVARVSHAWPRKYHAWCHACTRAFRPGYRYYRVRTYTYLYIYVSMHALAAGASRHAHSTASSALVLLANILLSWYLYTSLQERRKLPLRPTMKTRGRLCLRLHRARTMKLIRVLPDTRVAQVSHACHTRVIVKLSLSGTVCTCDMHACTYIHTHALMRARAHTHTHSHT